MTTMVSLYPYTSYRLQDGYTIRDTIQNPKLSLRVDTLSGYTYNIPFT